MKKKVSTYKLHELRMWIVQVIVPAVGLYITCEPIRRWVKCKVAWLKWKMSEVWYKIKNH